MELISSFVKSLEFFCLKVCHASNEAEFKEWTAAVRSEVAGSVEVINASLESLTPKKGHKAKEGLEEGCGNEFLC